MNQLIAQIMKEAFFLVVGILSSILHKNALLTLIPKKKDVKIDDIYFQ